MTRKKNIVLLNSTLHIGGAENVIANLCRSIDTTRFNISVCFLKECGSVGDKLRAEGFNVIGVKKPGNRTVDYLSFLKLRNLIQERRVDLLHSHDLHSLIDASLCRLVGTRVRHIHTFHFGNYPHRPARYLFLERLFSRIPNQLVAVGNVQKKSLIETFGLAERRIRTILNGVAVRPLEAEFAPVHAYFVRDNRIVIGSISTLIEQKGISYLLDVAAELKKRHDNFVVVVAGEGVLRPMLEKKCDELGLGGTVFFLGWVNDAAASLLPDFDVFFQPSLWEAMSMVVLEAMAQGKPVVATRVGENPFIVEDGVTGYLTEARDVAGMVAALDKIIRDPKLRTRLGVAGHAKWKGHFDANAMAGRYSELYEEILSD